MPHDQTPRVHRGLWTGLLAIGAAVVLVAQLVLVTSSIHLIDGLLQGTLTSVYDRGLRGLPWLSVVELVVVVSGIVVVASTGRAARRGPLFGAFIVLGALAVWALAASPASDLLIRVQDYHRLRDLYAVALTVALITAGLAVTRGRTPPGYGVHSLRSRP